ncbi:MAG: shikimate dehydrogenase [Lysobacteraceae bacterium]|nr:MAG: shikimate dehydrogenase [Xanthomonadaceae bacterium]
MKCYAVFGQPIAHSLSPRIHAAFAAQAGIALEYRAIEAGRDAFADALAAFARAGGVGANITSPLKQDALELCRSASERARRCGSVNTLVREGDGWHGDSTDGVGLLRDLAERHAFDPAGRRVLLLGAGGAARAVAFALVDAGVGELVLANRTRARAEALADALGARARATDLGTLARAGRFDLVLDASAASHAGGVIALPPELFDRASLAYALSYGAPARGFLESARAAGAGRCVDGLGMLVEQAAEAFSCWHGLRPRTQPVHAALHAG